MVEIHERVDLVTLKHSELLKANYLKLIEKKQRDVVTEIKK